MREKPLRSDIDKVRRSELNHQRTLEKRWKDNNEKEKDELNEVNK
jgi:hypothetical protein